MISIVIPVKNGERFLRKCVESILNNSYSDYEIIIVENASQDNTRELCYQLAAEDCRIRVITTDKPGLAHARNLGMDAARGEWLTFVDADDYVGPYLYESMLAAKEASKADIIFCDYVIGSAENYQFSKPQGDVSEVVSVDDYLRNTYLRAQYKYSVLWNKLIRRSCIGSVLHDEKVEIVEDRNFTVKCVVRAKVIVHIKSQQYYYWRGNEQAVTKSATGYQKMGQVYGTQADLRFFETMYPQRLDWQEYVCANLMQYADFRKRQAKKSGQHDLVAELKPVIKSATRRVWRAKSLTVSMKARFLLEHYSIDLFQLLYRMKTK